MLGELLGLLLQDVVGGVLGETMRQPPSRPSRELMRSNGVPVPDSDNVNPAACWSG